MTQFKPLSLYIHWPFCLSKCPYCDFNSHVRDRVAYEEWEVAYLKEIDYFYGLLCDKQNQPQHVVKTIFFGGGTPSLMPPNLVASIILKIKDLWDIDSDLEVTLEANPTSVEVEKFKALRKAGVNRVSIGVQSFDQKALSFLGREHNAEQAKMAIRAARDIFPRYSFDLIYARPQQSLEAWKEELEEALAFEPSHLSLYQLTIEKGTAFYNAYHAKKFEMPADDEAAILYDYTLERLAQEGLERYEISNYAKQGQESRHNLVYWQYDDYVGVGPGAHGRLTLEGQKYAFHNHRAPEIYLRMMVDQGFAHKEKTELIQSEIFTEMLMMGLRLKEGISKSVFITKTGKAFEEWVDQQKLDFLCSEGLLIDDDKIVKCTDQGLLLLNSVIAEIA